MVQVESVEGWDKDYVSGMDIFVADSYVLQYTIKSLTFTGLVNWQIYQLYIVDNKMICDA